MIAKITVKDLILILHAFPLDAEVRVKKDGEYIEGAQLVAVIDKSVGALFA